MDIKCAVCGEPWDAYGVKNGDMTEEEAKLFLAGKGCPCCKGIRPEGMEEEEAYSDFLSGLLDASE